MKLGIWYRDKLVFETDKPENFDVNDIEVMESENGKHWDYLKEVRDYKQIFHLNMQEPLKQLKKLKEAK